MKKLFALLLALMMVFALAACGNHANQKAVVGAWQLVDQETQTEYGLGIQFTEDGKFYYGLTSDDLTSLTGDADVDKALSYLMSIEYEVISDTEMEMTISAVFGIQKETSTVTYSLNGDTLEFDGAVYKRVK